MLNVVSAEEALKIIIENTPVPAETERIALEDAPGRVVCADILSPEDLPAFSRSTVDGFAVAADDTYGSSGSIPAMLICDGEIRMGETPSSPLEKGHCIRIPTGGRLPENADAVCMIEYADDPGDGFVYVYRPVSVFENVVNAGDDCRKDSVVLKKGALVSAKHTAVLAALGVSRLTVYKNIIAGIISTGDELVDITETPKDGQIRNINSVMLSALVRETGACPRVYPVVPDDPAELTARLEQAAGECDMVLVSGGSSVGEKDNTVRALKALGTVLFHGISVKPGKPTIFGLINGRPVFGLPGHPQAAFFIFKLFAAPALRRLGRLPGPDRAAVRKTLTRSVPSDHGRESIVPVRISGDGAVPLHSTSGMVSVLSEEDGFIRIARNAEGVRKGEPVDVFPL